MFTNELPELLRKIVLEFIKNPSVLQKKNIYLDIDNDLFNIEFTIGEKTAFNSQILNDSHDDFIVYIIEDFIKNKIIEGHLTGSFYFVFNAIERYTCRVYVYLKKIPKTEFLIMENSKDHIIKNRMIKLKNKMITLLLGYPEGIDLTEIIKKTRSIKDPEIRKQILNELVNENKIIMIIDDSLNRKKRVYRAT